MTQWIRRVGRIITKAGNVLPAWRSRISLPDTLYNVTDSGVVPNSANSGIVFKNNVIPYGFTLNGLHGQDVMSGYSSGTLLEDVGGAFGTIVYGTGGHTRIGNNLLSLGISQDSPQFGWFQQPQYETAEVNGAELYYNRSEFDALPSSRKTSNGAGTESALTAAWLAAGGFAQGSMGCEGWIFPRKLVWGQMNNGNPHGFRYAIPTYVPASMTGWGAGGYLVTLGPQGPFAQGWAPTGAKVSDMVDASSIWPSGRRKNPVWIKNVATGQWTRLSQPAPDFTPYGFIGSATAVARDQKRVYVSFDVGNGTASWYYIDFSNGVAGATFSPVIVPKGNTAPKRTSCGAFTDGHPAGRHLWYWVDAQGGANGIAKYLVMHDKDAKIAYRLNLPGLGVPNDLNEQVGMSYDAANNRIFILYNLANGGLRYDVINIPADPTIAANYMVATRVLGFDPSVSQSLSLAHFYGKTRYHAALGVIFVPQHQGRMLAFRPS